MPALANTVCNPKKAFLCTAYAHIIQPDVIIFFSCLLYGANGAPAGKCGFLRKVDAFLQAVFHTCKGEFSGGQAVTGFL